MKASNDGAGITDADILEVVKMFKEAEVPEDDRYMVYWRPYWWAHPIKRFKQEYQKWRLGRL